MLLKDTASAWSEHQAPRLGAALAYYSVLSLAPMALFTLAIAGAIFGQQAASGQIVYQVGNTIGDTGAEVIQEVLKNSETQHAGGIATLIGIIVLLVSASGVFTELRYSLNRIWDVTVPPQDRGLLGTIRSYFLSFGLVISIGFLLIISLMLTAYVALVERDVGGHIPIPAPLLHLLNLVISFVVVTFLFAAIYKVLPETHVRWEDVWEGAALTAVLFTIGKFLLAFYIAKFSIGSTYGAAGSMIALLVWVYYSAQIFFFGAELTHMRACHAKAVASPTKLGRPSAS